MGINWSLIALLVLFGLTTGFNPNTALLGGGAPNRPRYVGGYIMRFCIVGFGVLLGMYLFQPNGGNLLPALTLLWAIAAFINYICTGWHIAARPQAGLAFFGLLVMFILAELAFRTPMEFTDIWGAINSGWFK